jgi:crossover junction endodeoxyribonuclease RuvC
MTIKTLTATTPMPKSKKPPTILGIDPGLADTGFGIIRLDGRQYETITYGTIKTNPKFSTQERLTIIYQQLEELISHYRPTIVGVEQLFFAKNAKTAMAVGQARGVILLAIGHHKLPIQEYTPLQVKMALTSYGRASKKQIQEMVKTILGLTTIPRPDDAADALAVAICCAHAR